MQQQQCTLAEDEDMCEEASAVQWCRRCLRCQTARLRSTSGESRSARCCVWERGPAAHHARFPGLLPTELQRVASAGLAQGELAARQSATCSAADWVNGARYVVNQTSDDAADRNMSAMLSTRPLIVQGSLDCPAGVVSACK